MVASESDEQVDLLHVAPGEEAIGLTQAGGGAPVDESPAEAEAQARPSGSLLAILTGRVRYDDFPRSIILGVGIVLFTSVMSITANFSYVGYMVVDFGVPPPEVGRYSGFIAGASFAGSAISNYPIGMASDRLGRRLLFLGGTAILLVCILVYGFSTSVAMAAISRGVAGVLCVTFPLAKAIINDVLPERHKPAGFTLMSVCWGFGSIVGPVLGGYTARLGVKYPNVFPPGSFVATWPYAMPSFILAGALAIGLVLGIMYIPETLHYQGSFVELTDAKLAERGESDGDSLLDEAERQEAAAGAAADDDDEDDDVAKASCFVRFRMVLLVSALYCMVGGLVVAWDEVMPLLLLLPREQGGFGLTTDGIANYLLVGGVVNISFMTFLFPKVTAKVSLDRVLWGGCLLSTACYAAMPFLATARHSTPATVAALIAFQLVYTPAIASTFTAITSLMNIYADREGVAAGVVNGLGGSVTSACRALSPMLLTTAFAWSVEQPRPFPFDYHLTFLSLALVMVSAGLFYWKFGETHVEGTGGQRRRIRR